MDIAILVPLLLLVAVVNIMFGAVILSRGLRDRANILFGLITFASTLWCIAIIGFYSPDFRPLTDWTIFTHLFAVSIAAFFFYFSAVFPKDVTKGKSWLYVVTGLPLLGSLYALLFLGNVVSSGVEGVSYSILRGYSSYSLTVLFYFFFGYVHLIFQYRKATTDIEKLQVRDVLIGSVLSSSLAIVPNLIFPYLRIFQYTWSGPIFTLILVVSIFLGIVRHKLFSIRVIVTEIFAVALVVVQLIQLFLSDTPSKVIVNAAILAFMALLSFLLIRGVYREVEQREKIEVLAKDLGETNDRQEKLIHFIGHEVKGYLTKGEYAFSEMIDGDFGVLQPETKVLATNALTELRKGVASVTDILKAANLKRGTVTYEMKPTDLRELIQGEVLKLRPAAQEKGLTLDAGIDANDTYMINADKSQLAEHVIRNLIDNSIKYTPTGTVTVGLVKKDGKITFTIKDTGVGISEEDKARLFTEGGHGKDSIKVNVHSTGYGLYSAKQIVEAHGGKIWAQSDGPGKGSEFFIEFPAV